MSEEYAVQTATPERQKVTRPRADALRNRERIVTAAREMFVEHGPDVPLDDVARRAGVGNATVYRNFPDRDALVREVVCSVMDRTARAAEVALAESGDAFEALERFVHVAADERISALCPMVSSTFDQHHPTWKRRANGSSDSSPRSWTGRRRPVSSVPTWAWAT
ncbi:hypothetical protein SUDANB135_03136 [Streptomyces sp. SudanB135_2055]